MHSNDRRRDGSIVEEAPCPPSATTTYAHYVESLIKQRAAEAAAARREGFHLDELPDPAGHALTPDEFQARVAYAGFECVRFKYRSDGLAVVGFLWKPTLTEGRKLPVIIFNRGGNRELSKLTPWYRFGFHYFLSQGFVVIGSQYRGNDGGDGKEEFGGADVDDVMNLLPVARELGYADIDNVFMLGESRGGMMTYLALKNGMQVNAAAVIGGVADLVADARTRPGLLQVAHRQLIPDFDERSEERMRERSAVYWPEKLNAPLLIMHGGADWRVDARAQALALAQQLHDRRKIYELVVYAQDDHALSLNREDSDRRIVHWFRRFMK